MRQAGDFFVCARVCAGRTAGPHVNARAPGMRSGIADRAPFYAPVMVRSRASRSLTVCAVSSHDRSSLPA